MAAEPILPGRLDGRMRPSLHGLRLDSRGRLSLHVRFLTSLLR